MPCLCYWWASRAFWCFSQNVLDFAASCLSCHFSFDANEEFCSKMWKLPTEQCDSSCYKRAAETVQSSQCIITKLLTSLMITSQKYANNNIPATSLTCWTIEICVTFIVRFEIWWVRKEKAELNPLTRSIFYLNQSQGREVATVNKSNKTKML